MNEFDAVLTVKDVETDVTIEFDFHRAFWVSVDRCGQKDTADEPEYFDNVHVFDICRNKYIENELTKTEMVQVYKSIQNHIDTEREKHADTTE